MSLVDPWVRVRSHRHECGSETRIRVPRNTTLQFACISMATVHIDTSSVRSEFHSYECRSCIISNPYGVNNTKFVLIQFIQAVTHI